LTNIHPALIPALKQYITFNFGGTCFQSQNVSNTAS
jgi:hypothetical protein